MKTWFSAIMLDELRQGLPVSNKFLSYSLVSTEPLVFKYGTDKYQATDIKMGKFVECKILDSETSHI